MVDDVVGVPSSVDNVEPISEQLFGWIVSAFPGDDHGLLGNSLFRVFISAEAFPNDGDLF